MSITSPDDRITVYNPVALTTEFPAMFPVFDNSDLSALVDGLPRTDFTVTASYADGISTDAKIVFLSGVSGEVIVYGSRAPRRSNRFINGAPFIIRDLNIAFDTIESEMQELARDDRRSVRVPIGQTGPMLDGDIPDGSSLMKVGNDIKAGPDLLAIASQLAGEIDADADRAEAARADAEDYFNRFAAALNPLLSSRLQTVGDGVTADFALSVATASINGHVQVNVWVGGAIQPKDGVAYTITNGGHTIHFSSAPFANEEIYVEGAYSLSASFSGVGSVNGKAGAVFADPVYLSVADARLNVTPSYFNRLRTQFYDPHLLSPKTLVGGANYRRSTVAEVANYPTRGWFQDAAGAYWLLDELEPNAHQFGGIGDGVTDDAVALQQLLDFWSPAAQIAPTTRAQAMAGGGRVHIPAGIWRHTVTLFQNAFVAIRGDGVVMFPQAPFDGSAFGQWNFPNGTILRPDFASANRALGVGIQTSPYVLSLAGASAGLTGQTVGTRFKSLTATSINGPDVDAGLVNYCEGAHISDLSIFPVNEILAGVRWTAASNSIIRNVGARNVKRGIMQESAWESSIINPKIYDFKEYGIYGGGNQHAVAIQGGWIHAGGRVVAGDKPVGIYSVYFNGLTIDAIAVDECWDAIKLESGAGARIDGVHSERTKNVWLTTNGAYGIRGSGNHCIQNVVDSRTFTSSLIWDGNDCDVEINVSCNLTGQGNTGFPGKTFLAGTNPNTGDFTSLHYASAGNTSVVFDGMPKLATDADFVSRYSGCIEFRNGSRRTIVAGETNANLALDDIDLRGQDGNVKRSQTVLVNGVFKGYCETDAFGVRWYDSAGVLTMGFQFLDHAFLFAGGLKLFALQGSPEGFSDGNRGSLCIDSLTGKMYIKTSAIGTLTGWVVLGTQS